MNFQNIVEIELPISIPYFLEDIDPMFKFLKCFLVGSSPFVGARPFQNCQKMKIHNFEIHKNKIFLKPPIQFLYFFKYVGICRAINNDTQGFKNPEIIGILVFGLTNNKIAILLYQNEAD